MHTKGRTIYILVQKKNNEFYKTENLYPIASERSIKLTLGDQSTPRTDEGFWNGLLNDAKEVVDDVTEATTEAFEGLKD